MVLKSLIVFSLSFSILAQDHKHCDHNDDGVIECYSDHASDKKKNLAEKYLEWWAASSLQVKNAKCREPGKPTAEQMSTYINRKKSLPKISKSFFGMKFVDEDPHLVEMLQKLTEFAPLFSGEDDKLKQKKFTLPAGCTKVLCAAESIFGKDQGLKMLYALDKYEINLSHLTDENLAAWKSSEIDIILEGIDDLPDHLLPFEKNQYFKHYKRGYGPSASTVANATITVFSVWEDLDNNEERMSSLIHEIGHNIGSRLDQDESKKWLDFSGWVEKEGKWTSSKTDQIVSKYGLTNPAEDFAETFTAYRYNPATLKKMSPDKYNYMKDNVFLGLEYDSEEKCKDSNSTLAKIQSSIKVESLPIPQKYGLCHEELLKIVQHQDVSLKSCIKKSKMSEEIKNKLAGKDKVQIDAINQALAFQEVDGAGITDQEELEAYQIIVGDLYGSIAKSYSNYGDNCDSPKKYGWQDFMEFNQYTFGDRYKSITRDGELNKIVTKICEHNPKKENMSCKDLKMFMLPHIPTRLYKATSQYDQRYMKPVPADNTYVKLPVRPIEFQKTEVVKGSSFRCPM